MNSVMCSWRLIRRHTSLSNQLSCGDHLNGNSKAEQKVLVPISLMAYTTKPLMRVHTISVWCQTHAGIPYHPSRVRGWKGTECLY